MPTRKLSVTAPARLAFGFMGAANVRTPQNNKLGHPMKTSLLILSLGLATTLSVNARDFGRFTTVQTGRGVATRQVSGSAVPGTGASRTATTTGPQGKTATAGRQVIPTEAGRSTSGSYTGPQGQSVNTHGSVTRADGVRSATRSATGPQGQTKSVTKTTTRN